MTNQNKNRRTFRDQQVKVCGPEKSSRIDLGLALMHIHSLPGQAYSRDEVAAWAGCSVTGIAWTEYRALAKMRKLMEGLDLDL